MTDHHDHAKGTPVSECGLDETTLKLVHLSRFYFTAYAAGENPDCEIAIGMCKKNFGDKFAVDIAMGQMSVLAAMRQSRKSTFQYNSTTCETCRNLISDCERLLFSAMQAERNGNRSEAYVRAMILCEGHDIDPLFKAIRKLNVILDRNVNEKNLT